jgi:hypothetical protein
VHRSRFGIDHFAFTHITCGPMRLRVSCWVLMDWAVDSFPVPVIISFACDKRSRYRHAQLNAV